MPHGICESVPRNLIKIQRVVPPCRKPRRSDVGAPPNLPAWLLKAPFRTPQGQRFSSVLTVLHWPAGRKTREATGSVICRISRRGHCAFGCSKRGRLRYRGICFQGRYKAVLVDGEVYLLGLVRYIHLNPVRAGFVVKADEYPWSGHRAYPGLETLSWVTTEWALSQFPKRKDA